MAEDTPVSMAFKLQRQAIEQSHEALKRSIEFQQRFNENVATSFEGRSEAQQQSADITRQALHSYLDTVEALVPGATPGLDQVRDAIDEQFEAMEEMGTGMDTTEITEANLEQFEEMSEAYLDAVEQQLDILLEAHEDVETQTQTFLDQTEAQLEELQSEASEQMMGQIDDLQSRIETLRTQLETAD